MIKIKEKIEGFLEFQSTVEENLDSLKKVFKDEDVLWSQFEKIDDRLFLNANVMNILADSLQLINDEKRIEAFDLQDIKKFMHH